MHQDTHKIVPKINLRLIRSSNSLLELVDHFYSMKASNYQPFKVFNTKLTNNKSIRHEKQTNFNTLKFKYTLQLEQVAMAREQRKKKENERRLW